MATRTVMPQPLKSARSGRPTFYICQVAPRLGGRRIRSSLGNIWHLLAVPGPTSNCLKIRWLRCTKFDIYVVFQGLIKNSKSVDFRLSSPGFLTRSPTPLTHLVRTVPRPWFNCSVRPRLVPSSLRVQCFFVRSLDRSCFTPSPRCPSSATSCQISKQRTVSANQSHQNVGLRRLFLCEGPFGHLPLPTRNPRYPIRWARSSDDDGHQVVQLAYHSWPNSYARIARFPRIDSSPSAMVATTVQTSTPNDDTRGRVLE